MAAFDEDERWVRRPTVESFAHLDVGVVADQVGLEPVLEMLSAGSPAQREAAAHLVERYGHATVPERASEPHRELVAATGRALREDPDRDVRVQAVYSLRTVGRKQPDVFLAAGGEEALLAALDSETTVGVLSRVVTVVREVAEESPEAIAPSRAVAVAREMADHDSPVVRSRAEKTLAEFDAEAG